MIISPVTAVSKGYVKFPEGMTAEQTAKCMQPNAIDFTIDRLFRVDDLSVAVISEETREFKKTVELLPDENGFWELEDGVVYDIMSNFYLNVPEGAAAEVVTRSSLIRVGLLINTGLWDSGFKGNLGGVLHVRAGNVKLGKGTRVAQVKFTAAVSNGAYAGGYNTAQGQHWTTSTNAGASR